MNNTKIYEGLTHLVTESHRIAVAHGWWDGERNAAEALLKIIVEVAEAVQALEAGNPPDKHLPSFDALTVELADVIIRVCDLAAVVAPDLACAVLRKMEYNEGRPYRHGKAF